MTTRRGGLRSLALWSLILTLGLDVSSCTSPGSKAGDGSSDTGGQSGTGAGGSAGSTTAGSGGLSGGAGTGGNGSGAGGVTGTGGGAGGGTGGAGSGGTAGSGAGMGGMGAGGTGAGGATITTFSVTTDRYDNARSASNTAETILTTSNVTAARFGLLFSRAITGLVYGQPLFVGGLSVNGVTHNVVYVATEHNMVYAFDADSPAATAPLWSRALGTSLVLGAGGYDPGCTDMRNEVGITGTPVISLADRRIYLVAKTTTAQELHALDLATGADVAGSPVQVGNTPMTVFDPQIHLNRAGLLLSNGTLYIAYSSHCDAGAYHGWVFGYDPKTLALKSVFNPTPTGIQGAIWQSGVGLTSDGTDVWATVGNGTQGGNNLGNNVVRLTPVGSAMNITAHYAAPALGDNDLQSGAVLLGNTGQVVGGGKDGDLLLLGQSDLTLKQSISLIGTLNSFAFWNGSAGPMLYVWPETQPFHAYQVGAGVLTDKGTNAERHPAHPAGMFTVSSNGAMPGTGIVWATVPLVGDAWHATATGALYAFDASDITKPSLWNSTSSAQDTLGTFAKYSPPMVANGKVYVATFSGALRVYGLK